jgi:hypothetical protein
MSAKLKTVDDLKGRTKAFALKVIAMADALPGKRSADIIEAPARIRFDGRSGVRRPHTRVVRINGNLHSIIHHSAKKQESNEA